MINIGKVIFSKIRNLVNDKVFPLVAEQGTSFPYIVYRRSVALPQYSKDKFAFKLRHSVEVRVVTEKYDEGVRIVEQIFNMFDNWHGQVGDINVVSSVISSLSEQYIDNSYVQMLTLQIDTD